MQTAAPLSEAEASTAAPAAAAAAAVPPPRHGSPDDFELPPPFFEDYHSRLPPQLCGTLKAIGQVRQMFNICLPMVL